MLERHSLSPCSETRCSSRNRWHAVSARRATAAKPSSGRAATASVRASAARSGARSIASGLDRSPCGRLGKAPVLPHGRHRFPALPDGERGLGGIRAHGKRRRNRCRVVPGRREHAEPGGGVECRLRLSAGVKSGATRVRARGSADASAAALYPGADRANRADRVVQPVPFAGTAAVSLDPVVPGPVAFERIDGNAGADRRAVGRASRRRYRGHRPSASGRTDPLQPRPYRGARSPSAGSARLRVLCDRQTRVRPPGPRMPAGRRSV